MTKYAGFVETIKKVIGEEKKINRVETSYSPGIGEA